MNALSNTSVLLQALFPSSSLTLLQRLSAGSSSRLCSHNIIRALILRKCWSIRSSQWSWCSSKCLSSYTVSTNQIPRVSQLSPSNIFTPQCSSIQGCSSVLQSNQRKSSLCSQPKSENCASKIIEREDHPSSESVKTARDGRLQSTRGLCASTYAQWTTKKQALSCTTSRLSKTWEFLPRQI